MDISIEEKSAWVTTVIVLLLLAYYLGGVLSGQDIGPSATLGLRGRGVRAVVAI